MSIPPVGGAYKPYLEINNSRYYLFYFGKKLTLYKNLISYLPSLEQVPSQQGMLFRNFFPATSIRFP
jgi:hypothetical protein